MKHGSFYVETYGVTVHLLWPVTPEKFDAFVRKTLDLDDPIGRVSGGACIESLDSRALVIGLTGFKHTPYWYGLLAHECAHACEYALTSRGIAHTKETSEAYAYFTESLVRRCLQILMRRN